MLLITTLSIFLIQKLELTRYLPAAEAAVKEAETDAEEKKSKRKVIKPKKKKTDEDEEVSRPQR